MRNNLDRNLAPIWKKGLLVTNTFLKSHKFVEHYEWLKEAAKQYHIALSLLDNVGLLYTVGEMDGEAGGQQSLERIAEEYDFILYWDKDIPQGRLLQAICKEKGVPVYNKIEAVAACDNKFETYYQIWEWNRRNGAKKQIQIIPTIAAPMTYDNIGYNRLDFVGQVIDSLGLPLVIKECYGSFGMQVYLAERKEDVLDYTKKLAGKPFLYQKYLEKSRGRDVRLQVVGDKVVASMYRFSETGDFRANITNGGSMKAYVPSKRECDLAVQAVRVLGLDFAGVDLLFSEGESGEADVVCEVNSNAHFKNIFTCTGVNVAECIMEYIVMHGV